MSNEFDCIIIGAGLAGLAAAKDLQSAGLLTLVIESSDRPGGRVKSDIIDGFTLDHGFQVINRGYPAIRSTGIIPTLNFTPMVDSFPPFRVVGGFRSYPSAKDAFLRGVFLTELHNVSPRVRREIYKYFLLGRPGFVDGGVSAFSDALAAPISDIHYNETVHSIEKNRVLTAHASYTADSIVVATDPVTANQLIPALDIVRMNGSITWYHASRNHIRDAATLRVNSVGSVINSFGISDRVKSYAPSGMQLFSSTTLDTVSESEVRRELSTIWKTDTSAWELVGCYEIKKSLPVHPTGKALFTTNEVSDGLYVAGDHRGYPSQQGAMESGKRAARLIIERALRAH